MPQTRLSTHAAPLFVLIHSPLVGPLTWSYVARELEQKGLQTAVPSLRDHETTDTPYWRQYAHVVARALDQVSPDRPCVLVAHSGGGMLLPAVRQMIDHAVVGYIFVDAGIPVDGKSRLDLFDSFAEAAQFRHAAVDGLLPTWIDADLVGVIPDAEVRQRFVAELRPMPLAVYEEPIPAFVGWPDAPCGYIQFGTNPAYEADRARAREAGWPMVELAGGHFHMLVDPSAVAQALVDLAARMAIVDRS